jgi:ApbE superfamily uncharacterized protein (UPF0280 family)
MQGGKVDGNDPCDYYGPSSPHSTKIGKPTAVAVAGAEDAAATDAAATAKAVEIDY